MIVGVPKEIKVQEYRVGVVPGGARQLIDAGHTVLVQRGAGLGSGIEDSEYERMGAEIVDGAEAVWARADMIVKVKEPIPSEYGYFRDGLILYTYLHLAAAEELARALVERGVTSIAYETIETADGRLPLLTPMSAIAGRMAVQVGASSLEKEHGGMGLLLGGVPGTGAGHVVILGGGVVGTNAAKMAAGLGARVTVLDRSLDRLAALDDIFLGRVGTLHSNPETIERAVREADLLIGAVLVAGARAPHLVSASLVSQMRNGSVIVDVSVDQGGCIATCHATTHDAPTYLIDGVVHYCVANMPGAVARTSTFALTNATSTYALALAQRGVEAALSKDPALLRGLNTYRGHCTHQAVAESLDLAWTAPASLL
ncbi:MAG: alanine dehydrogenase [Deltaproteobacteria bacterium]|nr:alanine dehydrogenase [Deltaproteobacteria bacterium]